MTDAPLPIVLVHGGGHGAWCRAPLLPSLGDDAIAVDLPPTSIRGGRGRFDLPPGTESLTLADWADAVVAAADGAGFDRFVLVGHSLAGLTICETARRVPERVAHLVFLSAFVPPDGETAVATMAPEIMDKVAGGLTEAVMIDMFCSDLDPAQTRLVLDNAGSEVFQMMVEPVHRAGIPSDLPKTYVRLTQSHALPPSAQDASIATLRAVPGGTVNVVDLESGHSAMISHPADLAAILHKLR